MTLQKLIESYYRYKLLNDNLILFMLFIFNWWLVNNTVLMLFDDYYKTKSKTNKLLYFKHN